MGSTLHWPALVTLATLVLLFGCAWLRRRLPRPATKCGAPATTGPAEFERAFRVQMNTLENAVIFLPALWLASIYFSPRIAAAVGAVWVAARALVRLRLLAQPARPRRALFSSRTWRGAPDAARGVGCADLAAVVNAQWLTPPAPRRLRPLRGLLPFVTPYKRRSRSRCSSCCSPPPRRSRCRTQCDCWSTRDCASRRQPDVGEKLVAVRELLRRCCSPWPSRSASSPPRASSW